MRLLHAQRNSAARLRPLRGRARPREAAACTPLGSLMVETDSPFLAPVPHRGRPNRPALVGLVGAAVADAKGLSVAEVAETTTATATRFYGLDR